MTRVAIVSGGGSGIGRAVAKRLAAGGYEVTAFSDDEAQIAGLRSDESAIRAECVDITDAPAVERLVESVVDRAGRVDVLCNAAGVKYDGTVALTTLDVWERTFAVNVTGAFVLTKAVVPAMIRGGGGAIINIGSPSGYGGAAHVAYAASKGALLALGASLAIDHVRDGIRVNTVVPGPTRTGMNADRTPERERALAAANVAGRVNEPDDVAQTVAFLCSDASATVSGAVIEVGWRSGQSVGARDGEGR